MLDNFSWCRRCGSILPENAIFHKVDLEYTHFKTTEGHILKGYYVITSTCNKAACVGISALGAICLDCGLDIPYPALTLGRHVELPFINGPVYHVIAERIKGSSEKEDA